MGTRGGGPSGGLEGTMLMGRDAGVVAAMVPLPPDDRKKWLSELGVKEAHTALNRWVFLSLKQCHV